MKNTYHEAIIGKDGIVSRRELTPEEIDEIKKWDNGIYLPMFDVLCKHGKRCPKCDVPGCENRVKPYRNPRRWKFWKKARCELCGSGGILKKRDMPDDGKIITLTLCIECRKAYDDFNNE